MFKEVCPLLWFDEVNRCISGVLGWDFGLVLSIVFVACVRQLGAVFFFFFFLFSFFVISRMSPGEVVFSVVPGKKR